MTKKNTPLVSVILPTYNRATLLPRAVKSVLSQTYKNFELIIIDDNSSDNTEAIVKRFKDVRIRYIRHKENKGAAAARNTGIKLANGEYIAFQDSDDEWLPQKLEKQLKVFENLSPKFGVVYSGFWHIRNGQKKYLPSSKILPKEGNIFNVLLYGNFITTQTLIAKKDCLINMGMFDEILPRLQDWEFWVRISKQYLFRYISEPLVITYFSSKSISSDEDAYVKALIIFVKKYEEDLKKNRRLLAEYYFSIGNTFFLKKEFKKGENYFIKAINLRPLKIRYLLGIVVTFFAPKLYIKLLSLSRKTISLTK